MPDLFNLIARWYDQLFHFLDTGPLLRLLDLAPGQRVLDVGGGTGRVAQTLEGVRVVVCDASAGMARQARHKGLLACRGCAERLPFADGAFDALLVVDAFHHFSGHGQAAREMLRVLRPGGRLVVEEPDIRQPTVRLIALGERLLGMGSRFLSLEELGVLFERAGGAVTATETGEKASVRLVVTPKAGRRAVSQRDRDGRGGAHDPNRPVGPPL